MPAVNDVIDSADGDSNGGLDQLLQRDRLTKQERLEIECKKARYQVSGQSWRYKDLLLKNLFMAAVDALKSFWFW